MCPISQQDDITIKHQGGARLRIYSVGGIEGQVYGSNSRSPKRIAGARQVDLDQCPPRFQLVKVQEVLPVFRALTRSL
jgi:hypothetical protein